MELRVLSIAFIICLEYWMLLWIMTDDDLHDSIYVNGKINPIRLIKYLIMAMWIILHFAIGIWMFNLAWL